jgi:(E)-4-hydroxy-3-methylbut-2-enyl-diphosphate synthase
MNPRRISKAVRIGGVTVGGGAPVVVQSMTKTDTRNIAATINQICQLEECGCEIIRVAVPDMEAASALKEIKKGIRLPLVADIHFDYRLALAALKAGVDGLRLNPGNIRDPRQVAAVVQAAKERGVPIRIGVNAGSLPSASGSAGATALAERMVEAALEQIHLLESLDFDLIKVSLKAFDVATTVEAYKIMAEKTPYPLHLGITEAGLPPAGALRSAVGLGILLYLGIGDTIRVSLTADPREEVIAAYEILKSLGLRQHGATLVSCPTCGRCEVDLLGLAKAVKETLTTVQKPIKVAVMGCVVNGPGEARDADVGIACGKGRGAIFRKGEVVRTVKEKDFLSALVAEIEQI